MEETLTYTQQYFRQYYQDNKDKYRARANSYYHKNWERMKYYREYYAKWYEENKEHVNASRRKKRKQLSTPSVQRNVTLTLKSHDKKPLKDFSHKRYRGRYTR